MDLGPTIFNKNKEKKYKGCFNEQLPRYLSFFPKYSKKTLELLNDLSQKMWFEIAMIEPEIIHCLDNI